MRHKERAGLSWKQCEGYGGKTKEKTHIVCKEVGVRKREQVTPEGCGENISGGITKRIGLEMEQKKGE